GPLVAELGKGLWGEGRAVSHGAVEQHRGRSVGRRLLDPRLEVAARNVHRARNASLLPLVALAHVDEYRSLVEQRLRAGRVGFFDLGLDGLEQISVRRHRFRLYSGVVAPQRG